MANVQCFVQFTGEFFILTYLQLQCKNEHRVEGVALLTCSNAVIFKEVLSASF
jgi:hypothetical protein